LNKDYFRKTIAAGENIFSEGEPAGMAYLIHSGKVRIHKTENGQDEEIDTVGPGKIFGEMGVISDATRMASATAVEETVLTCCYRREMVRRVDALDKDNRDALRFLIVYCQEFLPYEMMEERPDDSDTIHKDKLAAYLVSKSKEPSILDKVDPFLKGLYDVLVGYAERRLPGG